MRRLIVNADDFGWSEAVTSGILRAHRDGIVTSTTLMTNLPGAEDALERARREAPALAIGVHLNLTEGEPIVRDAGASVLVEGGRLRRSLAGLVRLLRLSAAAREAAARELEAQVRWARDHGLDPYHIDSHKHVHLCPALLPAVIALARRHGIRAIRTTAEVRLPGQTRLLPREWTMRDHLRQWAHARVARRWGLRAQAAVRQAGLATSDWFFGVRATGGVSADLLAHLLRHAPQGTGELMIHPGLPESEAAGQGEVARPTRLAASRPRELAAACDPAVRRAAESEGWTWANYEDLCHDTSS
jgi:predicted glycoside hydrolase/deacetylase ChbG (UPF0249 family)